jgi:hypothetical protein
LFVVVPCAAFAAWWVIGVHALDLLPNVPLPTTDSTSYLIGMLFDNTTMWLKEMVGVLGWNDVFAPSLTYVVWVVLIGGLSVMAILRARLRELLSMTVLVVLVLVIPMAISLDQIHRLGVIWQGRYILPLAVGFPLLAIGCLHARGPLMPWTKRLVVGICSVIGLADLAVFLLTIRRFTVGSDGPIDYLHGPWQPPLGAAIVSLAGLLSIIALMVLVSRMIMIPELPAIDRDVEMPLDVEDASPSLT